MGNIWEEQGNPLDAILGIPGTLFRRGQAVMSPHARGVGGVMDALANPGPVLAQDRLDELRKQHPEVFTAIDYDLANGNAMGAFRGATSFEAAMRSQGEKDAADAMLPIIYSARQQALAGTTPMGDVARMAAYEQPNVKNILAVGKGIAEQGHLGAQQKAQEAQAGKYNQQGDWYGQKARTAEQMRPLEMGSERALANQRNAAAGASSAHAGLFKMEQTSEEMRQKGTMPATPGTGKGTTARNSVDQRAAAIADKITRIHAAMNNNRKTAQGLGEDEPIRIQADTDYAKMVEQMNYLEGLQRQLTATQVQEETGIGSTPVPPEGAEIGEGDADEDDAGPPPMPTATQTTTPASPTVAPAIAQPDRGAGPPKSITRAQRAAQLMAAGYTMDQALEQTRKEMEARRVATNLVDPNRPPPVPTGKTLPLDQGEAFPWIGPTPHSSAGPVRQGPAPAIPGVGSFPDVRLGPQAGPPLFPRERKPTKAEAYRSRRQTGG